MSWNIFLSPSSVAIRFLETNSSPGWSHQSFRTWNTLFACSTSFLSLCWAINCYFDVFIFINDLYVFIVFVCFVLCLISFNFLSLFCITVFLTNITWSIPFLVCVVLLNALVSEWIHVFWWFGDDSVNNLVEDMVYVTDLGIFSVICSYNSYKQRFVLWHYLHIHFLCFKFIFHILCLFCLSPLLYLWVQIFYLLIDSLRFFLNSL